MKAFYNFASDAEAIALVPTSDDFRYRDASNGWFNFASGNRGADIAIPVSKDDIIVFDCNDTQSRGATINSVTNGTKVDDLSTTYPTFTISADANVINVNIGRAGNVMSIVVMEPVHYTWDFTNWSDETKTNLKADKDASQTDGWSDREKEAELTEPVTEKLENCYWNAGNVAIDGELVANGVKIEETDGLTFHANATRGHLALAVDYGSTTLGTYAGSKYLWLGNVATYFTIPNVKAGSSITMAVESHKTSEQRGVQLSYGTTNLGEAFKPTSLETNTWIVPDAATLGASTVDIKVQATAGCHIYWIDAEIGEPEPPTPTTDFIEVSTIDELRAAIAQVNASNTSTTSGRVKIFLKNGIYDFGTFAKGAWESVKITANNVSFIGESMTGVIIKATPHHEDEGLGKADLFYMTGQGNYFQDLTLQNALDYYTAGTGRAAVMQDASTRTIYKNVRMLSYQDTYYSHKTGQKVYFEGGEVHGTVDYICGTGDVFFKDVKLVNESRTRDGKTGDCTITAQARNQGSADKGYVFDGCTIESNCATFNFGRSWDHAKTVFLNTTVKSGTLVANHWTIGGMNSAAEGYYEYNTKDASGNSLRPTNWTMTFTHSSGNNTINTQLDAAGAATYSLANFFSDWTPNTLVAQVEATGITIDGRELTFPDGTYLVETEDGTFIEIVKGTSYTLPGSGYYTLRRANGMGGFGPKSEVFPEKPSYPITATWNFVNTNYPASEISGIDTTLPANEGTPLIAELKAKSGKLRPNGGTAQFNKNTELWIPVGSTKDIVTVTSYTDATRLIEYVSIGGVPMATQPTSHRATEEEVRQGYVVVKGEQNTFLKSIKVVQQDPDGTDKPTQEGNWMRFHLNDYEEATESDWVRWNTSNLLIASENDNSFSRQSATNDSRNQSAYYTLSDKADIVSEDVWKLEWDARLLKGLCSERSQSSFAIRSTNSSNTTDNPAVTNTYMYLGSDQVKIPGLNASQTGGSNTRTYDWYLKDNSGNKIPLTTGFTDFTLSGKWYHFKFTYNGKNARVLITDGTTVVADASYELNLPVNGLKDFFSTVGRAYGGADVDNISLAIYNKLPEFTTDLPTEAVEAKTDFTTKLKVEAEGAKTYQWYKNTTASTTGGQLLTGETGTTLSITPDAEGTEYYYVVATNRYGSTTSRLAVVNVTKPVPEITKLEFGDFNFEKKAFSVTADGIGQIHISYDGGEYVDYDPENLSNSFALNTVTAYATTKDGQSMPVTVTQPITYDPNKPFAAWYYQDDYINSTTKAEMEHEAQYQPITREIGQWYNLINVHLPNNQTTYDTKYPTLGSADLIICSEMETGGQPIAQSLLPLLRQVPFLSYKAYNYGIDSHRWEWGEPYAVDDLTQVTVTPNNPWLKMFDGVKVVDTSGDASPETEGVSPGRAGEYGAPGIDMYDKNNGAWNDAIKHLQYVNSLRDPADKFTTYATAYGDGNIFMHGICGTVAAESEYKVTDGKVIPARYDDGTAPYMLICLNFDNAQAVSEEAIQMSGNIAEMMLKGIGFEAATEGVAPEVTDNGDGSAHIASNIYKGTIYYRVVEANAAEPEFDEAKWQQVDANGNTEKQRAGEWKVYAVAKFPESLTGLPSGVTIPTGTSEKGIGTLTGSDIRVVHFRAGTTEDLNAEPPVITIPSQYSIISKGEEVKIGSDYKIPMNFFMVKAEPGKEDEPVRPYYRFAGWTADQAVIAMTRNERPDGFDPLNPPTPIPDNYYPAEEKPAGTLLGTTTFVRMPENDLTFTSQFYKNKVSLANASEHTLVTWDFTTDGVLYDRGGDFGSYTEGTYTQDHLGQDVWPSESMHIDNDVYYYNRLAHVHDLYYPDEINQLDFSYRYIDVPLFIDARDLVGADGNLINVRFDNTESPEYVETTDGMIFGIPAVYGMTIKLLGANGTTFGGANSNTAIGPDATTPTGGERISAAEHHLLQNITGAGTELVSMKYMGKPDYLYVYLGEGKPTGGLYMKGISVIYPARVNITPQVKVGDAISNEAGKIYYKPVNEEVHLAKTTPFTRDVADTLIAKAAYGYKFVGWYDNAGTEIKTGIAETTEDGNHNTISSTLAYTPTANCTITAKFEAIDKVKLQVTTYRETPADEKVANQVVNEKTVSNDKGEYASFVFTTSQLGETVEFVPTYNDGEKCYEIDVTPGTEVTIQGIQVPGNRFKKWSKWTEADGVWTEDDASIVTENPHTFTVSEATTYYVQYEDVSGGYIVTYQNGGESIVVPLTQDAMFEYAAPKYHTAYKEGYSLLGWKNSTKYFIYQNESEESTIVKTGVDYNPDLQGVDPTTMEDDYVLTPMYARNNALSKLAGRKADVTVTWDFTRAQRAQVLNFGSNAAGKYVARAVVKANDDKYYSCDVPMTYDTGRRGRINNTASEEWCTIGQGTTLTVPACKGAVVTFVTRAAITDADGGTRINGVMPTLQSGDATHGYVYTYTVNDDLESVDVVLGKDYSYYKYIRVNLPPVREKHEVALIASDLTDLASKYHFNSSAKTFTATGTGETITLKAVKGTFNINPTSSMASNSQYVANEKGYMHCPKDGQGFTISGMKDITRICFRQGARINNGNGWKVVANAGGKNAKGQAAQEVVLLADHKSTVPEWIELNDIYLDNNPIITFYNLSYQEREVDKTTTAGPYDVYLFNLEMYSTAETTDAQMTLEVGGRMMQNGELVEGGGNTWVDPYTMCLPTTEEQTRFHESAVRPVPGLEHYAIPRRTMQFDEGTEVVMTAEPNFGFQFESWIDEEGNVVSTKDPYCFSIHENEKIYAKYRPIGHIVYTFGGENYEGSVPSEQEPTKGWFTVPVNHTLYKDANYSLTHWINPDDPTDEMATQGVTQENYEVNKQYPYTENDEHFTDYEVYLSPVFSENTFNLLDVEEPVTVRWPFGQKSGAPEFNIEQRTGFEVGPLKKSNSSKEFIDVRMSIDATKQPNGGTGKVNNVGRTDEYAQVNQNTVFTFPVTKGMRLTISSNSTVSKSTLGGVAPSVTGKTATFYAKNKGQGGAGSTLGGNEIADAQLYINDANQNFQYIEATYYPRLKAPGFSITDMPITGATVRISAPVTAGTTNEQIYYTMTTNGNMPADPTSSSTPLPVGGQITRDFDIVNGIKYPIVIKAINIADNRPDSKITTFFVMPYDETRNTVVYFFNSADRDYDMAIDPVLRTVLAESQNQFNVVPYDISTGIPAEGAIKTAITDEKVKAYVASDKDKVNAVVTGINTASKPVVSLHNVLDDIVTWNADGTEFKLKNTDNDNLAIFNKVLIAYNQEQDVNDAVCVSNTGSLIHSGLNYNAAFVIGNATKALIDGHASSTWATATTTEPQVRKQMFAGRYVSAFSLGLLAGGQTNYPIEVWTDAIQVSAEAEEGTGYIDYEQPAEGNLVAVVKLHSGEPMTDDNIIRKYTINLQMVTNTDYLVFTEKDNNTETHVWDNGTWNIRQDAGDVSGNDGECFKFNMPVEVTITGPANYGIKSVTFHGYDYVSGGAGGAQISSMTATTVAGSMSSSKDASTIKKYNNNEYQSHVDGDLKLNFPMTSTNTTTIRLDGGHQFIGSIQVEYFERMTSAIGIESVTLGETSSAPLTLPHNGHISLAFNSVMSEVTSSQANKVTISGGALAEDMVLSAEGGASSLNFPYWGLGEGSYELTIPFAALKDIYGTTYAGSTSALDSYKRGESFVIPFNVDALNYIRKPFDFIVNDRDHDIDNWDGTHIEGLNRLGGNDSDERMYMLFLNSEQEYFIATGEQANKDNGTSTIFTDIENSGIMNGRTRLTARNLSLIGESQRNEQNPKGVLITSLPKEEGSSSTPTLEFKLKTCTDNYIQDITIRNKYDYNAANFAGRATAFLDNGTNTILKNVRLESWQDTYYTQGVRGYNEDCTFMGVVDFLYGHGDYWFENCNIILRDRIGDNIVAANTSPAERWGYVLNNCTIDKEYGASLVSSGSFTLGRPWQNSPAATFLYTKMVLQPTKAGWTQMGANLVVRYHEYGSKDENGNMLNLSTRSIAGLSPAKGSDSPVLTAAEAAKYNLHDVVGGTNGFDPTEHTRQIPRINDLYVDGQELYWKDRQEALCYLIYYLGDGVEPNDDPVLIANIAPEYRDGVEASYNLFNDAVFWRGRSFDQWYGDLHNSKIMKTSDEFTHGWFAVRAANQRGGLNEMSNAVEYHKVHEYRAVVSTGGKENGDETGNVWSTVYLDFNAKVPNGVKAYALTGVSAFGGADVTETTVHLKRVSINLTTDEKQDVIYANMGYVLYGPGPAHAVPMTEYRFIETGHMNIVDASGEEESRTDFTKSFLRGTVGVFRNTIAGDAVGELGERGWSSSPTDYNNVPVGYTTAYTLATKTVENTSFGLGFYKYTGTTFGHHKAYLDTDDVRDLLLEQDVDASSLDQLLSRGLAVVLHDYDDTVTDVFQIENNRMMNTSNDIYNLQGIKVRPDMMRKGEVYIMNGKKIRY